MRSWLFLDVSLFTLASSALLDSPSHGLSSEELGEEALPGESGQGRACQGSREGVDRPKEAKADRRPVQTVLQTNNQGDNWKSVPQAGVTFRLESKPPLQGKKAR